jgi:hypothetical protein
LIIAELHRQFERTTRRIARGRRQCRFNTAALARDLRDHHRAPQLPQISCKLRMAAALLLEIDLLPPLRPIGKLADEHSELLFVLARGGVLL